MRRMMKDEKEGQWKALREILGVMDDEYVYFINCDNGLQTYTYVKNYQVSFKSNSISEGGVKMAEE